jgi:D-glycero-alpha-D-manno-heptose-7-phosphate kinase
MITIKCPVRVSLIGGSSDLDSYIQTYKKGSVISFTPNLFTYVSLYKDVIGRNNLGGKYIINYSKREELEDINDIENDLVREYFKLKRVVPCSVHMTSDVFSHGSGLAVSSSYSCGIVYAVEEFLNNSITQIECGINAHKLEKYVNPLLGLQDVFGCCIGGFKKIEFCENKLPNYSFLPTKLFEVFDLYLIFTGHTRSSTEVLKTVNVPQTDIFNQLVTNAEELILKEDFYGFANLISEGWNAKKLTSKNVLQNPDIKELDCLIPKINGYVSHKLCGAGNGGFFLCFVEKGVNVPKNYFKITLANSGVVRIL